MRASHFFFIINANVYNFGYALLTTLFTWSTNDSSKQVVRPCIQAKLKSMAKFKSLERKKEIFSNIISFLH